MAGESSPLPAPDTPPASTLSPPPATPLAGDACGFLTPCPKEGNYFYCTAAGTDNDATDGCKLASDGAFPSFACSAQCLTGATTDGSIATCTIATQCNPEAPHYYCTSAGTVADATGGCKEMTDGPFDPESCGAQCLTDV
jgi:hypothetical protein